VKASRALHVLAALGAAALTAAAADTPGEKTILTGSDEAVWLLHHDAATAVFDLAIRKADGNWQWVEEGRGITGRPAAAVAAGRQLHVLFADRAQHITFNQETGDRAIERSPSHRLWPSGAAPVALCEEIGADASRRLVAIVARPPGLSATAPATTATAPATSTATAPATSPAADGAVDLGIFRKAGAEWAHLADWRNVRLTQATRVFVAAVDGAIYVLLSDPAGGANRLRRWDGRTLSKEKLAGELGTAPAVGLFNVRGRLILLSSGPAGQDDRRQLLIATFDAKKGDFSTELMAGGEGPATWAAGALPQVTRLGDQLALAWREGEALRFGTCVPHTGDLVLKGDIDVFDRPPLGGEGEDLMTTFLWAVFLASLVPMFLLRPRGPQEPFALPETIRTGHLGKRILAVIIDFVPIYLVVLGVFMSLPSAPTQEEMMRMLRRMLERKPVQVPVQFAIVSIAMHVLFAAYGTILEARYGTTLGKWLMKLRVVGTQGAGPGVGQCILRNLMKIIELSLFQTPFFFLVPLIPIFTRYRRRFGDLLARTAVVDARPAQPTQPPEPAEPAEPTDEPPRQEPPPRPPEGPDEPHDPSA
jgi:uncharacterized RDD family membrane protein YckC